MSKFKDVDDLVSSLNDVYRSLTKKDLLLFLDKFYPDNAIYQDGRLVAFTPNITNLTEDALFSCMYELVPYQAAIYFKEKLNKWQDDTLANSPFEVITMMVHFDLRRPSRQNNKLEYNGIGALPSKCRAGRSLAEFEALLTECIHVCINNPNELTEYVIALQSRLLQIKGTLSSVSERKSNNAKKRANLAEGIEDEIRNFIRARIDILRASKTTAKCVFNDYLRFKFPYFIENRDNKKLCPTHLRKFFNEYFSTHKSPRADYCLDYYLKNKIDKNNSFYNKYINYIKKNFVL